MDNFDQMLLDIKNTWNRVTVPGMVPVDELDYWLDENCTGRYYLDTMFLTPQAPTVVSVDWTHFVNNRSLPELYLETIEDMIFYNLTWSKYNG
jgi:hypothetical protein